jgi:thioredoxin 1
MGKPFCVTRITKSALFCTYLCKNKINNMPTVRLTADVFKSDIFDYTTEKEWKYKGTLPAIIDFYADWCGPCKMVAPILEALSDEYKDQLVIYKVDTEVEMELSSVFRIRSIPSILFIPMDGQPMMQAGALPKATLKNIIDKELVIAPSVGG